MRELIDPCDNCGCHEGQWASSGALLCTDCLLRAQGERFGGHGTPTPSADPDVTLDSDWDVPVGLEPRVARRC